MSDGTLCRALNGHAWKVTGGIVVLKDNARRILLQCSRCESFRTDVWTMKGHMGRHSYHRDKEYVAFLKSTDRPGARLLIIAQLKEVRENVTGKGPTMRSVPTGRARGRHTRAAQRRQKARRDIRSV